MILKNVPHNKESLDPIYFQVFRRLDKEASSFNFVFLSVLLLLTVKSIFWAWLVKFIPVLITKTFFACPATIVCLSLIGRDP